MTRANLLQTPPGDDPVKDFCTPVHIACLHGLLSPISHREGKTESQTMLVAPLLTTQPNTESHHTPDQYTRCYKEEACVSPRHQKRNTALAKKCAFSFSPNLPSRIDATHASIA